MNLLSRIERPGGVLRAPRGEDHLLHRVLAQARTPAEDRQGILDLGALDPGLKPILLMAYDTGMRKSEVLGLTWSKVDLERRCVRLSAADTKTKRARTVYLSDRVVEALEALPNPHSGDVFRNPETREAWKDIRTLFNRACSKTGLKTGMRDGVIFHDLRRSFVTNARRRGIPESVVMRMSGHRTRAVFDRYNIVNDDDVRNAVGTLEEGRRRELAEAPRKESAA